MDESLVSSLLWFKLLKVFERFNRVKVVKFFLFIVFRRWFVMKRFKVLVEWSFLFLFWWEESLLLLKRYVLNWLRIILLYILEVIVSSDRGWLFEVILWFFFLSKGIIFVNFYVLGYLVDLREEFIIFVRGFKMIGR